MKRTVVLCANPALELTYFIHDLRGGFVSCDTADWAPGGKGTNVARILQALDAHVHLVQASGGYVGQYLKQQLDIEGLSSTQVEILPETRASVVLVPSDRNEATIVRYPGFATTCSPSQAAEALLSAVRENLQQADALCIAGSLPPGCPIDTYARLCELAEQLNCRVYVDCYGPLLVRTLDARPFLVKTNRQELEDFCGNAMPSDREIMSGLAQLVRAGAQNAVATLDSSGALAVLGGQVYELRLNGAPQPINPIGAGDAFMAGLLWAREEGFVSQLKRAGTVAMASTRSRTSGTLPPSMSAFHRYIRVVSPRSCVSPK
jgi:1-phosphofructokinase family hexose kinase